jgi:hypothetical protein
MSASPLSKENIKTSFHIDGLPTVSQTLASLASYHNENEYSIQTFRTSNIEEHGDKITSFFSTLMQLNSDFVPPALKELVQTTFTFKTLVTLLENQLKDDFEKHFADLKRQLVEYAIRVKIYESETPDELKTSRKYSPGENGLEIQCGPSAHILTFLQDYIDVHSGRTAAGSALVVRGKRGATETSAAETREGEDANKS